MAESAKFWICEDGHLHVSLLDANGEEFAAGACDPETSVEVVFSLGDQIVKLYLDEVADTIGPTVGNAL